MIIRDAVATLNDNLLTVMLADATLNVNVLTITVAVVTLSVNLLTITFAVVNNSTSVVFEIKKCSHRAISVAAATLIVHVGWTVPRRKHISTIYGVN